MTEKKAWKGPLWIVAACLIWSSDAIFRYPTSNSVDPVVLVFYEHLVALSILSVYVLKKYQIRLFKYSFKEWMLFSVIGIGGSAIGTVFFSASFKYVNPSVTILLQKLQPILVILMAMVFLNERPKPKFYFWAVIALAAAVIVSFPDFKFPHYSDGLDSRSRGVLYGLIAMILWGCSTVAGRYLSKDHPISIVTFWRFALALLGLGLLIALGLRFENGSTVPRQEYYSNIFWMGTLNGLAGMLVYYRGLRQTQASTATLAELSYPILAVIVNTVVLHLPLSLVQIGGGAVLIFCLFQISRII